MVFRVVIPACVRRLDYRLRSLRLPSQGDGEMCGAAQNSHVNNSIATSSIGKLSDCITKRA